MKLAIMQPYIFPYLGYFQLLQSVDKFVIYDDVTFIKKGWINKNNILVDGKKHAFTIPVKNISQNVAINETYVSNFPNHWDRKLLRKVNQSYRKAPFFESVFPLVETILSDVKEQSISLVALNSIKTVLDYLGIVKQIIVSSNVYNNNNLKGEDRIIDICKREKACTYINSIGGKKLYKNENFKSEGLKLFFVRGQLMPYKQLEYEFIAGLSIIDILMFCSIEETNQMLNNYDLL
jgi:hypothetical protein